MAEAEEEKEEREVWVAGNNACAHQLYSTLSPKAHASPAVHRDVDDSC